MNSKVTKFLNLITEGKSVNEAANESSVNEMKTHDLLDSIAILWKGINAIKELDDSLVELIKVTDKTVEELQK